MTCVADDSTECDCETCRNDEERWEREQGWHDDGADEDERDQCVLGADCLVADPFHRADECFDIEMAETFMRAEPMRAQLRGRQRTRALWRRRGRR